MQLKMFKYIEPCDCEDSFHGFTYRTYNGTQADRDAWLEICKTGKLLDYEENAFERYITSQESYRQDLVFFVLDGEKPIATITVLDKRETIGGSDLAHATTINNKGWICANSNNHIGGIHDGCFCKGLCVNLGF